MRFALNFSAMCGDSSLRIGDRGDLHGDSILESNVPDQGSRGNAPVVNPP